MKTYILIVVSFILGALSSYFVISNKSQPPQNIGIQNPPVSSDHSTHGNSMTMDEMVSMLRGKNGDEFDKAFIEGMIEHHQGAIDMAELAKLYAGHDEIKQLAEEIIKAQTKEIQMMKNWKTNWRY